MDNVGIVVESLDTAIAFFGELGLELPCSPVTRPDQSPSIMARPSRAREWPYYAKVECRRIEFELGFASWGSAGFLRCLSSAEVSQQGGNARATRTSESDRKREVVSAAG